MLIFNYHPIKNILFYSISHQFGNFLQKKPTHRLAMTQNPPKSSQTDVIPNSTLPLLGIESQSNLPVTQQCLGCICEAISGCNTTNSCSGDVCGPFRITWAYWADAGKPTVGNESPEAAQAYAHCAGDTYCAALAVQGYMNKFQQVSNRF